MWNAIETRSETERTGNANVLRPKSQKTLVNPQARSSQAQAARSMFEDLYEGSTNHAQRPHNTVGELLQSGENLCQQDVHHRSEAAVDVSVKAFREAAHRALGRTTNKADRASVYRILGRVCMMNGLCDAGEDALFKSIELGDHSESSFRSLLPSFAKRIIDNSLQCAELIKIIADSNLSEMDRTGFFRHIVRSCMTADTGLHLGMAHALRMLHALEDHPETEFDVPDWLFSADEIRKEFIERAASRADRESFLHAIAGKFSDREYSAIHTLLEKADRADCEAHAYCCDGDRMLFRGTLGALALTLPATALLASSGPAVIAFAASGVGLAVTIAGILGVGHLLGIGVGIGYHLLGFGNTR